MLPEVEIGQAVIERGIGTACQDKLDRLVEAVGRNQFRTCFLGQAAIIAGEGLGCLLALQIGEILDRVILIVDDENNLGNDIGIGEVELLLPFLCDADLIDDGVVAVGVEAGNEAIPFAFHEFRLHTELSGDGFTNLHVEANKLVVLVVIGEGA